MKKTLVIVESPSKAKTINKYLPKGYKVEATMGHVRDLPKSKLGIDIDNNFEPKYITIRGKGDVLKNLKTKAKKSDLVLLATDPDREGEAISWHIAHYLNLEGKEFARIEFNEITKEAIKKAIKNKREIDMNLVDAQQGRRILDRLVGYKISPLLWKKIKKGLSAGRVQSVATRLIVDREKEIIDFVSEEYWNLETTLSTDQKGKNTFQAKYQGTQNKKEEIPSKEVLDQIIGDLKAKDILVDDVKKGTKVRRSPQPFTTSTLQQDAFSKLNFSTKKTMSVAQQLYEGLNISGKGNVGLITYMRTDSTRISDEIKNQCKSYIENTYGSSYVATSGAKAKKSNKKIQDAHEAIRPTSLDLSPATVKDSLKRDQYRLYKLIWNRFMASQMAPAKYDTMAITMFCDQHRLRSYESNQTFDGFLKVYGDEKKGKSKKEEESASLPDVKKGDLVYLQDTSEEQKFTSPPPRYTEASLVKTLEEKGIGRPSTYSPTIQTIIARRYVENHEKKFHPTELGIMVTELIEEYFKKIIDYDFTAQMEKDLDEIAEGNKEWQDIIRDFYQGFRKDLEYAEQVMEKIEIEDPVSDVQCEKCGRMMVIKDGRYGKFLACPGFPECRNTKTIVEELGIDCPECEDGTIIVKKSKKGRKFYGCSNYPDCTFTVWDQPVKDEKCPKCDSLLLQKGYGKIAKIYCSNDECDYSRKVEESETGKEEAEV